MSQQEKKQSLFQRIKNAPFFQKKWVRNKYTITLFIFFVYVLLIDENDIFFIIKKQRTYSKLKGQHESMLDKYDTVKSQLRKLSHESQLESYARSEKYFKAPDEDIFVITYKEKKR